MKHKTMGDPEQSPGKKPKLAPGSWDADTTPFEVVRYFALPDVTDDQIRERLLQHKISSLSVLEDRVVCLHGILGTSGSKEFTRSIAAATNRTKGNAIEVLGGKLEHDKTCITDESLELFAPAAVSVSQSCNVIRDRVPNFTLVTGPSGSGKTMFAVKALPEIVFPHAQTKQIFTLHLPASDILTNKSNVDLPSRLAKYVQDRVAKVLKENNAKEAPGPLDLYLLVVIDEAGGTDYRQYFDSGFKINQLVASLQDSWGYRFTRGVHVTLAGTALEITTRTMDSKLETIKFRMQPWKEENFHAFLHNLERKDKFELMAFVRKFPILRRLTTNARCAQFLIANMPKVEGLTRERCAAGFVDICVYRVAQSYIASNGLSNLSTWTDKFTVAREAFRAINMATIDPVDVYFPNFDHIQNKTIQSAIQSLLETNVETRDGTLQKLETYSVSMTPAIMIVLAELLCERAGISWSWQGLEITAALGEWKKLIADQESTESPIAFGILRMRSAVPAGNARVRFTLPVVGKSTVLVNGRSAPYADVMAPFRLVQTKLSIYSTQNADLDFEAELNKMGVTTDTNWRLQQAITSVLYVLWQASRDSVGQDYEVEFGSMDDNPSKKRFEHYPCQTLLADYIPAYKTARFMITDKTDADLQEIDEIELVQPDGTNVEAVELLRKRPVKVLENFDRPVTAVFVTNCDKFVWDWNKEEQSVGRDDVDWQGRVVRRNCFILPENLRKNVELRFLFY